MFASAQLQSFFDKGGAVWCVLLISVGRVLHLVVLYGYQGVDSESEQSGLRSMLLDAALCELAVVSREQPTVMVGDFNMEPTNITSL